MVEGAAGKFPGMGGGKQGQRNGVNRLSIPLTATSLPVMKGLVPGGVSGGAKVAAGKADRRQGEGKKAKPDPSGRDSPAKNAKRPPTEEAD